MPGMRVTSYVKPASTHPRLPHHQARLSPNKQEVQHPSAKPTKTSPHYPSLRAHAAPDRCDNARFFPGVCPRLCAPLIGLHLGEFWTGHHSARAYVLTNVCPSYSDLVCDCILVAALPRLGIWSVAAWRGVLQEVACLTGVLLVGFLFMIEWRLPAACNGWLDGDQAISL